MTFKFGSGPGIAPIVPLPRWPSWRSLFVAFLIGAAVVALKIAARGGCSLPPAPPLDARRDEICALLGRGPDCRTRIKDTMTATIDSDELYYRVYVAGEFIGEWPIANGTPIDPALLTKELVDYHLQFQTGDPEFQQRLRSQFHCRRIGFVDRVLEWHLGETKVLIACAS